MAVSNEAIRDALAELEVLPSNELQKAYEEVEGTEQTLASFLVDRNLITDENLGQIIADIEGMPFVNLRKENVSDAVLHIAPVEMVRRNWIFPFRETEDTLHVATNDPGNLEILSSLQKKLRGKKMKLYFATKGDIELASSVYRKDIRKIFEDYIKEVERRLSEKPDLSTEDALKELPIVRLVDTLLLYAYQSNASDIHIEPREKSAMVRFRIDGIMQDVVPYPKYMHDMVVTRLKIMAKLRTDEHFAAQDGKIRTQLEGEAVDIRINVVPILEGEKVVMRLLTERGRKYYLETIGMSGRDIEKVRAAAKKPFGMILSTGPTGSGKTTTMYAVMKILNTRQVNITTIEDPIEYDMVGVNQIQVNTKTGITFASGLRSIVRQNPDIIMVGEIRDEETAGIAVNAAMTGHLVLSTLHTNNAATALPRLLDMKVEPFLISSSVNIIIAQRLVRKICPKCITSNTVDRSVMKGQIPETLLKKMFGKKKKVTTYHGAKCELCRHTGYIGRIGIFELLEVTPKIKELIMQHANADVIERVAIAGGMRTMLEDGIEKVLNGQTTMDELLRVIRK